MLRGLTILIAALAVLYGGYWFLARSTAEDALTDAAAMLEAQGWSVGWDDLVTRGFPSRFDTTLTSPRIAGPDGDFAWAAPFLQLLALAYRPTQVIAVFPPEQSLMLAGENFDVETASMRASATVRATTELPLADATVEIGPTRLDGPRLAGGFEAGLLALRATEADPQDYDAFARLTGVTLPPALAQGPLPAELERIEADALVTLSAPLDRAALAEGGALIDALDLRHLTLVWGPVSATAAGTLSVEPEGTIEGTLGLEIDGWKTLLGGLNEGGVLDDDVAEALRRAGGLLTLGGEGPLELDLTFRDGRTFLGPVAVGPAPVLR